MHGNKTVKRSEFNHSQLKIVKPHELEFQRDTHAKGFYNRKTREPFTNLNGIGYAEDPYERKEDIIREEYSKNNSQILFRS